LIFKDNCGEEGHKADVSPRAPNTLVQALHINVTMVNANNMSKGVHKDFMINPQPMHLSSQPLFTYVLCVIFIFLVMHLIFQAGI
jgi:hypothetical protein